MENYLFASVLCHLCTYLQMMRTIYGEIILVEGCLESRPVSKKSDEQNQVWRAWQNGPEGKFPTLEGLEEKLPTLPLQEPEAGICDMARFKSFLLDSQYDLGHNHLCGHWYGVRCSLQSLSVHIPSLPSTRVMFYIWHFLAKVVAGTGLTIHSRSQVCGTIP